MSYISNQDADLLRDVEYAQFIYNIYQSVIQHIKPVARRRINCYASYIAGCLEHHSTGADWLKNDVNIFNIQTQILYRKIKKYRA